MASYTKQIVDALHRVLCDGSVDQDPTTGSRKWTKAILTNLQKLGQDNGFTGRTREGAEDADEGKWTWFFDHVWAEYNKAGHLVDVPLVAESELDASTTQWALQREDFEKLLVANTPYRLFICEPDPTEHSQDDLEMAGQKRLDELTALLEAYRRAYMGAVFLIVIMKHRGSKRYLRYRELVCGHSGWEHRDGERDCSQ